MAAGSRLSRGLAGPEAAGCRAAVGAAQPDTRARSAEGRLGSAAAMSLGTAEPASETVSAGGPPHSLQLSGSPGRARAGGRGARPAAAG